MSNYTSNELAVIGSNAHLNEVSEGFKTSEQALSFEAVHPTPKSHPAGRNPEPRVKDLRALKQLLIGGKNSSPEDWYTWRIVNWGTKWDINPEDLAVLRVKQGVLGKPTIYYEFITAWASPLALIGHASIKYPNCAFRIKWQDEFESKKEQIYIVLGEEASIPEVRAFFRAQKGKKRIPTINQVTITTDLYLS